MSDTKYKCTKVQVLCFVCRLDFVVKVYSFKLTLRSQVGVNILSIQTQIGDKVLSFTF